MDPAETIWVAELGGAGVARCRLRAVGHSGGAEVAHLYLESAAQPGALRFAEVSWVDGSPHRFGVRVVPLDIDGAAAALDAVAQWLTTSGLRSGAQLRCTDAVLRHLVRRCGWVGSLDADLELAPGSTGAAIEPPWVGAVSASDRSEALAAVLTSIGAGPVAAARRRLLGSVRDRLVHGESGFCALSVDTGSGRSQRLLVPAVDDLLVEEVARAVIAVRGLFARFPTLRLEELAFSKKESGMGEHMSGAARTSMVREVTISPGYVTANGWSRALQAPGFHPPIERTQLEGTIAHEIWHSVESQFEHSSYADSIDFRKEVGRIFGLETIEHVVMGGERGADPAAGAAYAALGSWVSGYAQTSRSEATAELFEEFWCSARPRPAARAFGALVDRYLPAP